MTIFIFQRRKSRPLKIKWLVQSHMSTKQNFTKSKFRSGFPDLRAKSIVTRLLMRHGWFPQMSNLGYMGMLYPRARSQPQGPHCRDTSLHKKAFQPLAAHGAEHARWYPRSRSFRAVMKWPQAKVSGKVEVLAWQNVYLFLLFLIKGWN